MADSLEDKDNRLVEDKKKPGAPRNRPGTDGSKPGAPPPEGKRRRTNLIIHGYGFDGRILCATLGQPKRY
jgi:hypothetical protein